MEPLLFKGFCGIVLCGNCTFPMIRLLYEPDYDYFQTMAQDYYKGKLSINKDPKSPYWFVTFEGADGKMKRRSTKVPVSGGMFEGVRITARLAEKLAYQRGVQIACAEEEVYTAQNNVSVREWCAGFTQRNAPHMSEASMRNLNTALRYFYEFLGKRADEPLRLVCRADARDFMLWRRRDVRAKTVRRDIAALSPIFNDALDSEVIAKNPFVRLPIPPDKGEEALTKEAFTMEELRYMIEKFPPEWASAVRCCFETYGQRLGDILDLDWQQFDWSARVVRFVTGKTGRRLAQPMRPEFYEWARERWEQAGCPSSGALHPLLLAKGHNAASCAFGALMRAHNIGVVQSIGGRRYTRNTKTFHSIRSTVATFLANAGVSKGMAQELVGHESEDIHQVYIRPTGSQLAEAAAKMPEL